MFLFLTQLTISHFSDIESNLMNCNIFMFLITLKKLSITRLIYLNMTPELLDAGL